MLTMYFSCGIHKEMLHNEEMLNSALFYTLRVDVTSDHKYD